MTFSNPSKGVLGATDFSTPYFSTSSLYGPSFGLFPDTGKNVSTELESALQAARVAGIPLKLLPGNYIYDRRLQNCGGGLVCDDGKATLENISPTYNNSVLDFQSTDSSYLDGIEIRNIKFTVSTRPDTGLSNDVGTEVAGFIRVTKARNVKIFHSEFSHNWGGGVLFRDVEDSIIAHCVARDLWKDCFHITDSCRNITRAFNSVFGAGDDAFPIVGYVSKGTYPVGILDIGNKVYGVRKARAFAYVGCRDVSNVGCYVDGKLPSYIPQQSDATGGKYSSACALYIAAESSFNSYGNENIIVSGFVAENIGPGIDSAGTPASTLQSIHIAAGNGASYPIKNIKIEATLRNIATRGMFVAGNGYTQDIEADIIVDDNTDPLGILSLTNTPGTGNKNAVEFQNTRNIKLKCRAKKIGAGAIWLDSNCTGFADLDISVGSVCQTTAGQSVIMIQSGSKLDSIDFKLNFETSPTASGTGSISRLIDNSNQGITRSVRISGVDNAPAAANVLNGWPMRTLTAGSSPTTILNTTGRNMSARVYGGTVSAIARTGIKGRATAKAVTTGANGTVQIDGDWTDLYVAAATVTFFNGKGVAIGTGVVASSSLSGGVTTVTFDATGVNASFAIGLQMGILNSLKTLQNRTNGVLDLPPETVIQVTYSAAPAIQVGDQSF